MKRKPKFYCYPPPSSDEMQDYFDKYDDIIDNLNDTGRLIPTLATVADSSDDSLEAFERRHPYPFKGRPLRVVEQEQHEDALLRRAEWQAQQSDRDSTFYTKAPPRQTRARVPPTLTFYALPPPSPPPPPPMPAARFNPFAEARRRKMLKLILEKTRTIREELYRRRAEGPEEYLFGGKR
jgi:hypothetical protein